VNAGRSEYDGLLRDVILHGSPATVIEKIDRLRAIGANSLMLHYPPWYGAEKAIASLELFAREVMPKFAASVRAGDGLAAKADRPDEAHVVRL
jgi:alkanesulfonate monooxygenase SsuD/methylene tetrahydromethanopterin reductase-like flavin-dependent oxidoreductase (luciferase family)